MMRLYLYPALWIHDAIEWVKDRWQARKEIRVGGMSIERPK